jgi:hypothetical protein
MQDSQGFTALMLAVSHSISVTPESSKDIVAKLLTHAHSIHTLRMNTKSGRTLLGMIALSLHWHSPHRDAVEALVVNALIQTADAEELAQYCHSHPKHVTQYLIEQRQRMCERQTTADALKAGLSLPGSILLTYL